MRRKRSTLRRNVWFLKFEDDSFWLCLFVVVVFFPILASFGHFSLLVLCFGHLIFWFLLPLVFWFSAFETSGNAKSKLSFFFSWWFHLPTCHTSFQHEDFNFKPPKGLSWCNSDWRFFDFRRTQGFYVASVWSFCFWFQKGSPKASNPNSIKFPKFRCPCLTSDLHPSSHDSLLPAAKRPRTTSTQKSFPTWSPLRLGHVQAWCEAFIQEENSPTPFQRHPSLAAGHPPHIRPANPGWELATPRHRRLLWWHSFQFVNLLFFSEFATLNVLQGSTSPLGNITHLRDPKV